jgi:ribosome maturation factor RimP
LYKPIEGKKEYQGELKQFNDGVITIIQQDGKEIQFIQKETASVRLAVIF